MSLISVLPIASTGYPVYTPKFSSNEPVKTTTSTTASAPNPTTSLTSTSTSDEYPPLTTLFTPDPSCSSVFIEWNMGPITYVADVFPGAKCSNEQTTTRSSLSCYPKTAADRFNAIFTYSPGYFCPVGMTTVTSVAVTGAVWCCPSGLTWVSSSCQDTMTQGTYISTDFSDCLGAHTLVLGTASTMIVTAVPILLSRHEFPMTTPLTSISFSAPTLPPSSSSSIESSDPKSASPNEYTPTKIAEVGIILDSIFGPTSLILLVMFFTRRLRKAKAIKNLEPEKLGMGESEFEGSEACVYTTKAELDSTATRAELEGTPVESHGDNGIYMLKPELEGTPGAESNKGRNRN